MKMISRVLRFLVSVSFLALCFNQIGLGAALPGPVRSMQLVNKTAGWASTGRRLFWTDDFGTTWRDVTPPSARGETIASVFFLHPRTGWVVLSWWSDQQDSAEFSIASTNDGGTSWSVVPLNIQNARSPVPSLGPGAHVYFLDQRHGWLNLDIVSSSNFNLGMLLASVDGGKTWHPTGGNPNIAGSIRFITEKDGWVAGGPGEMDLFVTHDGANTWQEVSLQAPASIEPPTRLTYDSAPQFLDSRNGFLSVRYLGRKTSAAVLFSTQDGGRAWNVDSVLPGLNRGQEVGGLAIADSTLISAAGSKTRLTLTTTNRRGTTSRTTDVIPPGFGILEVSFSTPSAGWALVARGSSGNLMSTKDGGASWADITPALNKSSRPAKVQSQP